jgi:hypothetical protein
MAQIIECCTGSILTERHNMLSFTDGKRIWHNNTDLGLSGRVKRADGKYRVKYFRVDNVITSTNGKAHIHDGEFDGRGREVFRSDDKYRAAHRFIELPGGELQIDPQKVLKDEIQTGIAAPQPPVLGTRRREGSPQRTWSSRQSSRQLTGPQYER